ncbi:MAG: hypothetical protein WCI40_02255 [Verrucomicrobiota bacterium]
MKLDRLPEYLGIVVTAIIGILLALYLGQSAGVGSPKIYMVAAGSIALLVALMMRENIWFLIPSLWCMIGKMVGMPGNFPLRDLVILYAFSVFLGLKALKVVRTKNQYNWLDMVLLFNLAYLLAVFIRNPVGTESMGSDRVGGKPYYEILALVLGYWVIGHVTLTAKQAQKFPIWMTLGDIFNGVAGLLTSHIPALSFIGRFYTGIAPASASAMGQGEGFSDEREGYLAVFGNAMGKMLFSLYSPVTCLNPVRYWRWLLLIIALISILKSGFRSELMYFGLFYAMSVYFRHGLGGLGRMALTVVPLLCLVVFSQGRIVDYPIPVQRALSFIPGDWDYQAVEDAEGSTEWRRKLWANVWTSGHKYIDDWWFGDGFGMTRAQFNESLVSDSAEALSICGAFHSLPLSAIRTVGYVGLCLFCVLLFCNAWHSWKLIRRTQGTPFFSIALFMGVPTITSPLPELILTGFFDYALINSIFSIAMMRMISRSLDKHLLEQKLASAEPENGLPELEYRRLPCEIGPATSL